MRLVAVPADADTGVGFSAEDLGDFGARATQFFDALHQGRKPWRDRIGLLQLAQRVIVPEAERGYPPLTLILTELKRLQRKGRDALDQIPFGRRRNEFGRVTQALGSPRRVGK